MTIQLWADGACPNNGQVAMKAGWAFILVDTATGRTKADSDRMIGFTDSLGCPFPVTNNRAELQAVIMGFKALKQTGLDVELHLDSDYVGKGITEWSARWIAKDFRGVANADLWRVLMEQVVNHHVTYVHESGHSGVELNERCDQLAVAAARS